MLPFLPEAIAISTPVEVSIDELPLEERIRARAYELYVYRGNQSGSETDDWLQAEEELRQAQEAAHADH